MRTRFAVMLMMAGLAMGCGEKDGDSAADDSAADDSAADDTGEVLEMDGATLYATYCAGCHGADGSGTEAADGIIGEFGRHDDAFIVDVILNGHGDMEPVNVTAEQAQSIVDWVRAELVD